MTQNKIHSSSVSSDYAPELYRNLLCHAVPLLDVRAPAEFAHGSFPLAHNIALLDNEQRRLVGTAYKQNGQSVAIALGHKLVCDELRQARTEQWALWVKQNPTGFLYCFRGGLRSQIVQQWLNESGVSCPRVPGGYKAMRRFLIESLESIEQKRDLVLIAGPTGSGKTEVIRQLGHALDLEGRAQHRGSAFGKQIVSQPTQINFENALAIDFLNLENDSRLLYVEDEGRAIGSLSLPIVLYKLMSQAPIVHIKESVQSRAQRILSDYIVSNLKDYEHANSQTAFKRFSEYLLESLNKIQRRLGGERYQNIREKMRAALEEQERSGKTQQHADWITDLLKDYYDPMYRYQLEKRANRIIFEGSTKEFWDWHRAR